MKADTAECLDVVVGGKSSWNVIIPSVNVCRYSSDLKCTIKFCVKKVNQIIKVTQI